MRKLLIILILVTVIVGIKLSGIGDYLTLDSIKENKDILVGLAESNTVVFVLGFILTYIGVVIFQIPGATILTLLAGAIFGPYLGTLWVNIGASIGSLFAFLAARYILRDVVNAKFGSRLEEFNGGVAEHGFNYILFLRLVPLFPFFLINVVAGVTGVKTRDYFLATVVGIIPGSFVYCNVASALWAVNSVADLVSGKILVSFGLLGLLALVPIVHKRIRN